MSGRIIILTGAPGTGKSTVAALVAEKSPLEKSLHMHTDDFYHYLKKGQIAPYLPESAAQNEVVMQALVHAAATFAKAGYDVVVDGIIGPWFLQPWQHLAHTGVTVNYVVLRATKEATLDRAVHRDKLTVAENQRLVATMWQQFADLGKYEENVLATTELTAEATAELVLAQVGKPPFILGLNEKG